MAFNFCVDCRAVSLGKRPTFTRAYPRSCLRYIPRRPTFTLAYMTCPRYIPWYTRACPRSKVGYRFAFDEYQDLRKYHAKARSALPFTQGVPGHGSSSSSSGHGSSSSSSPCRRPLAIPPWTPARAQATASGQLSPWATDMEIRDFRAMHGPIRD